MAATIPRSKPSAKAYGKARSLTNAVRDAIGAVMLPRAAEYKGRLATRPRESRSRVEGGDAGDSCFVRLTSARASSSKTMNWVNYIGGGLHALPASRHVTMISGLSPAANGEPASGVSAPLLASMA